MSATENVFGNFVSWKWWAVGGAAFAVLCVSVSLLPRARQVSAEHSKAFTEPAGRMLRQDKGLIASKSASFAAAAPPPAMDRLAPSPQMEAKVVASSQTVSVSSENGFSPDAPMIARTVSVTVRVKDLPAARGALDAILAQTRGYSAQLAEASPEDGPRTLSASLRVPAPELEAALSRLKQLGRVVTESQGGEEVTQQHQDLVARLKTARETEERYRAILVQRTGKVSDVLEVEEQIANVRGEIERMEAEQQGLEHRVSFASVDVQFTEEYTAQLDAPTDSVFRQVRNAFVAGLRHVGDSLLAIVLFAEEYGPAVVFWVLLLGAPVVWFWRRRRAEMAV